MMFFSQIRIPVLIIFIGLWVISCESPQQIKKSDVTEIVILAGEKSHPATLHEYIKNARLIKVMLDNADNIEGINTTIIENGWPDDPSILDKADLILTISDGRDGPGGEMVPFMKEGRMEIIQKVTILHL